MRIVDPFRNSIWAPPSYEADATYSSSVQRPVHRPCQFQGNARLNTSRSNKFYLPDDTAQHYGMPEHSLKKYFNVHRRTTVLSLIHSAVTIPTYYSSENADGTVIAKLDCSVTTCRSCRHFMSVKTARQAEILTSD